MKRRIVLTSLALLVTFSLAIVKPVAQQPAIDPEKSRQELDTMEGILGTTLGYAMKRLSGNEATAEPRPFPFHRGEVGVVKGYYLYGQGAVFMVPISALQDHQIFRDFAVVVPEITELATAEAAAALEQLEASGELAEQDAEQARQKAELLKQQSKERQQELAKKMEKQKAKLQELRENAKKRHAEAQEKRKELLRRMGEVKVDLKDALARYGDSLSIVKPDESVSIILSGESGFFGWGGEGNGGISHILTVKKSLVTDLKAGKLTREQFDRQVVDYSY